MVSLPLLVAGLWGVWRLAKSEEATGRRLWLFAATVMLALSAMPPCTSWAAKSLPNHMVSHIVLMFFIPIGLVLSGEVPPLTKRVHPLIPILVLNVAMVAMHLPAVFDRTMSSDVLRTLVVEPLFVGTGVWFFTVVLAPTSHARAIKLRWQLIGVISTTVVMFVLAMSMSIFTKTAWYSSMASMPGMTMPGDFHSQQLAAAILWICGDIWAVPIFVWLIRQVAKRDGSLLASLDRYASPSR